MKSAAMKSHAIKSNRKRYLGTLSLGCLLPCFMGLTLSAMADESQSEQEAFDKYFGIKSNSNDTGWGGGGHFSIGAMVGLNISASFKENGVFNIPGQNLASGVYDDGYVHEDATGNSGHTSYWGYDNASQYNATAHTLTMHSITSYATADSGARDQGGPFPGFDLDYGGNIYRWQRFRIGWDLGFDLLPMNIADNRSFSAGITENAYTYSTVGIVPPPAGYQGGPSSAGASIPSSPEGLTTTTEGGMVSGTRSLDMMLYAIRLGPTFYWDFARNFTVSLGVGPAMGIVSAEYKYNEVIQTANGSTLSSGSFSGTDVVFGGDVNATLLYHIRDEARPVDLYLTAQFMPLGSADFSQGGRDGRVDLSGQVYISAGFNWPF
jgi:hypothetical protein